jgi:small subunit ribosomal protein S18
VGRNPKVVKKKSQDRPRKPSATSGRVRRGRPKFCIFCSEHTVWVDYKDVGLLRRFVNDRGRIKARSATGTCRQHQRDVAVAIKTARELVLLPYAVRTVMTDAKGGRGGDRRGGRPPRAAGGAPEPEASDSSPDAGATNAPGVEESRDQVPLVVLDTR